MALMKVARINGRCPELASSTNFGYVYRSSFGSPGASAVNCFQTLQDKENNYYYLRYQEMNKKLPIRCDNDRLNLLVEQFSHVRIGFEIFSSRV